MAIEKRVPSDDVVDEGDAESREVSFYAFFHKAVVLRSGEVQIVIQVPADNKYDVLKMTDVREKLWLFTAEPPPTIDNMEDLDALYAQFFGEEA